MNGMNVNRRGWIALAIAGIATAGMLGFVAGSVTGGSSGAQASAPSIQPLKAAGQTPPAATLAVGLGEWHVTTNARTVHAGTLTMVATNVGEAPHDLVIVRTDAAPNALPVAGDRVDESAVTLVGRFQEFKSGEKEKHFQLEAGHYLLICNLPKHYQRGMVTELTVD